MGKEPVTVPSPDLNPEGEPFPRYPTRPEDMPNWQDTPAEENEEEK